MGVTAKKSGRGGYRPGSGRPTKLDYGSPETPAEIRMFVPRAAKVALAEHGRPHDVAPKVIESGHASHELLSTLRDLLGTETP